MEVEEMQEVEEMGEEGLEVEEMVVGVDEGSVVEVKGLEEAEERAAPTRSPRTQLISHSWLDTARVCWRSQGRRCIPCTSSHRATWR